MEASALALVGLALLGPAVGIGLARGAGALRPLARAVDIVRPRMIVAVAAWAGVVPVALAGVAGASWLAPAALFAWGGLAVALADLAALRAPHALSAAYGGSGLGAALLWAPDRAAGATLAGVGAFVLLHVARLAFRRARGRDGLGGGDPGVMAALAIWAGPTGAPWVLGLGAALALALAASTRQDHPAPRRLPLASCLVAASVVVAAASAALFGEPFWITEPL